MQFEWRGQPEVVGTLKPYLLFEKIELLALTGSGDKTLWAQTVMPACKL